MLSEEKMPQATVKYDGKEVCWQGFTLNCKVSFPNETSLRGDWRGLQQFTFYQHENCHNLYFVTLGPVGELI